MSKFLKFSLVSVLAIGTFNIAPTFAQEGGDVEEVIVTGSKIKKVDIFDSSKPLEVVDAAQIERTGLNNIGDVLQNLTSSDGTGIRPVTTATNGGDGSNEISLRNLGAGRTLVLIDGRRWVTDAFGTVDMQTIPASIIQRVEILKDVLGYQSKENCQTLFVNFFLVILGNNTINNLKILSILFQIKKHPYLVDVLIPFDLGL